MKKIDIINLIKAHVSGDEDMFRQIANKVANEFYNDGDSELSDMISSLIYTNHTLVPQSQERMIGSFLKLEDVSKGQLILPDNIINEINGIFNAINRDIGVNKFLFYGKPGTGKTEASKMIAYRLRRNLWYVSISDLIDSKLGATAKNIHTLFNDIEKYPFKKKMVVLFDELDALSLNRSDARDLREMARATTELFNGLDSLSKDVLLIATTNLFKDFDKALLRRFNKCINFDEYSEEDLIDIGLEFYKDYANKVENIERNDKLVKKILMTYKPLPNPGDLKNIIVSSIAFSNPKNPRDYYSRLVSGLDNSNNPLNVEHLRELGFSLRDIEKITGISKTMVGRRLNNEK